MQLPISLNTMRHVAEIHRIRYSTDHQTSNEKVVLYDHVKINAKVKDIWLNQASTRKFSVPLMKLSEAEISQGELNVHYRQAHDRVKCQKCPMTFSTPSTLIWDLYTHAPLTITADVGKDSISWLNLKCIN